MARRLIWFLLCLSLFWFTVVPTPGNADYHNTVPPVPAGIIYLAEMAGQGQYFIVRQPAQPNIETCMRVADQLNRKLAMYRWECVVVP